MTMALSPVGHDVGQAFGSARVLVTGGAGFIAHHLTSALLASGADLVLVGDGDSASADCDMVENRLVGRPSRGPDGGGSRLFGCASGPPDEAHPGWPAVLPLPVGSEQLRAFLRSEPPFDFVFHLAGRTTATGSVAAPHVDFAANLAATVDLLEQIRQRGGHARFIFTSSAAVYGVPARLPIEESDPTIPVSPYGLSKLAAEHYVALYAQLYGLSAASVRPFSVYGPFQAKQVVFSFLRDLRRTPGALAILGDGTQRRDLVYVGDVVRALMTVAVRGAGDGRAYNAATSQSTTLGELACLLVEMQGYATRLTFTGTTRVGDQHSLVGANDRLSAIGGAPVCSLRHGLRATIDWFNSLEAFDEGATQQPVEVRPTLAVAR